MISPDLGGVVVATALPYRADDAAPAGLGVDYDRYAEHCAWLVANGCRGVGPNGSLGEYSSLTDDERRRVARTAVDAVGKDGVVIVGVHGVGWHQAKRWAELAAEDGADGVLCLPPIVYRANRSEIIEHFTQVASVGLPVMVYNNPFDTKVDLTPDLLAELAQIDNIVAVKEASGNIAQMANVLHEVPSSFTVLCGDDAITIPLMALGGRGIISVVANQIPSEMARLAQSCLRGDFETARQIQARYLPLMNVNFVESNPIPVKAAMGLMGLLEPVYRLPLVSPAAASLAKIENVLEATGLLDSRFASRRVPVAG